MTVPGGLNPARGLAQPEVPVGHLVHNLRGYLLLGLFAYRKDAHSQRPVRGALQLAGYWEVSSPGPLTPFKFLAIATMARAFF